ncbi:hypothetical protein PR001_g750 [Phytophthora rubi]|uniref:Uncharacterized protein n=1 Tax=Phytophthora rubi TaxID=129364 RepID=A0A6A3P2J8_9STRA|nr:hypothetical protein PR001_g750 [Phytophthora rubi]
MMALRVPALWSLCRCFSTADEPRELMPCCVFRYISTASSARFPSSSTRSR